MSAYDAVELGRPAIAVVMTLIEGEDRSLNRELLADALTSPEKFVELFSGMTHLAGRLAADLAEATDRTTEEVLQDLALRAEW